MTENRSVVEELIDENGITIYSTLEHILLVLNTLLFGLSSFAIIRGSTPAMGVYRWFLLNEVVWSFLFDVVAVLFQPVFIFPGTFCGFVSSIFFRQSGLHATRLLMLSFCMMFIAKTHAFASALVHRFACAFPPYSRVSRAYGFVTPWLHIGLLAIPFFFLVYSELPYLLANTQIQKDNRAKIIEAFPKMKEIYDHEPAVGCVPRPEYSKIAGLPIVGFSFFAFLFLVYGYLFLYTRHLLQRQSRLTSSVQTLKLQQILLRACAVQVLGNFAFLFAPLIAFIWFIVSGPFHSQLYISSVYLMFSFDSIYNYICLIGFIRPYREITVNTIRQLVAYVYRFKQTENSQNVTIVQSCQTNG